MIIFFGYENLEITVNERIQNFTPLAPIHTEVGEKDYASFICRALSWTQIHMTEKAIQQSISIDARLNYLFYILVLGALVFFIICFGGGELLTNLSKLSNGSIYISFSSWDVPLIVGLPCFFALGYVLVLRLLNIASEQRVQQSLKIAVSFAFVAIVVRLFYGFTLAGFLSHKGYSSCWQYSSPQVMSPTVWVKSPGFCIANSGSVRKEVLSWMDALPNAGKNIRSQDVEKKVAEFLRQTDTEGY